SECSTFACGAFAYSAVECGAVDNCCTTHVVAPFASSLAAVHPSRKSIVPAKIIHLRPAPWSLCSMQAFGDVVNVRLPPLPYELDSLEPHLSRRTLAQHHGTHHRGYVDRTRRLIENTRREYAPLEVVVRESAA